MNRSGAIALGTVIVVLGLVMIAVDAQQNEPNVRLMVLAGSLMLGGIVRLMTAFSMDPAGRRGPVQHFDPTDPRWHGGSGEVQIAGKKCAECGSRITVSHEGVACEVCSEPAHLKCVAQHKAHAHRPEGAGPFR